RDADNHRVALPELGHQVAEILGFVGATGCVVLGIEVHHHPLALQRVQRDVTAIGDGALELGGGFADFDHVSPFQNFTGSMMASRLRLSQSSRKSSRNAAMWLLAGMPTVICAWNMSAPVCMA